MSFFPAILFSFGRAWSLAHMDGTSVALFTSNSLVEPVTFVWATAFS
jgi:hypothetical protein